MLLVFLVGWIPVTPEGGEAVTEGALAHVEALQSDWSASPSALAKSTADFFAWGVSTEEATTTLAEPSAWLPVIAVVLAPMSTVVFLVLSFQGLALPASELRRLFSSGPSDAEVPDRPTPLTVATHVAVTVVLLVILVQLTASAEHWAKRYGSPAALTHLPDCEAIDGKVYKLGTIDAVRQALSAHDGLEGAERSRACSGLDDALAASNRAIDTYLDWYFSLPAEWMRIWKMLTGDLERMLSDRLQQSLASEPALDEALSRVGRSIQARSDVLDAVQGNSFIAELEERQDQALRTRAAASAGVGLAAEAVAAKVAAKAMTKASMKAAAKALAKFAAKKAAAVSLSTATGAAIGSVIPVLGSVIGGIVGSVVGVTISVAVDWAALLAEEQLTRESMKAELVEEVRSALAPAREAIGCRP